MSSQIPKKRRLDDEQASASSLPNFRFGTDQRSTFHFNSPPNADNADRPVAMGALRRLGWVAGANLGVGSRSGSVGQRGFVPHIQHTTNNYTINMPAPQSDMPSTLRSYLWLIFLLYIVVQFIFNFQQDVEHRISEYSMGTSHAYIAPNSALILHPQKLFRRLLCAQITTEITSAPTQYPP
ncbi:hypothetical protein HWV62_31991 [Athelia sp. TMB]|nr:hypothetical protein HWV62_31991 [Athelia sp. TMB]